MLELNETDFDERTARGTFVVDFSAEWCPPCRLLTPIFERAAGVLGPAATFAAVDADRNENQRLLVRFGIQALPTVVVLRDGRSVHAIRGLRDEKTFLAEVRAAVGEGGPSDSAGA
jgi:thioredoxin 1